MVQALPAQLIHTQSLIVIVRQKIHILTHLQSQTVLTVTRLSLVQVHLQMLLKLMSVITISMSKHGNFMLKPLIHGKIKVHLKVILVSQLSVLNSKKETL